jgi:hypothetical protein
MLEYIYSPQIDILDGYFSHRLRNRIRFLSHRVNSVEKIEFMEIKVNVQKVNVQFFSMKMHETFLCVKIRFLQKFGQIQTVIKEIVHTMLLDLDSSFDDAAIIRVAECCPMLQNVNLSRYTTLTDLAIIRIAECCPELKCFEMNCAPITDIAIGRVAECCPT